MAITLRLVGTFKVKDKFVGLDVPRLAARILAWAKERYPSGLLHTSDSPGDGVHFFWMLFHEAGEPIAFEISTQGRIVVEADTTPVGPGYHDHVCTLLDELSREFRIAWPKSPTAGDDTPDASYDDSGHFFKRDWAALEQSFLSWIKNVADTVLSLAPNTASVAIKLSGDCSFGAPGDIHTVLGPRSRAWVRQVAQSPHVARDIFPWWSRDWSPEHDLNLALTMMWVHLPWAPPRTDTQLEDLTRVLELLASAHAADPSLPMPWAEWAELFEITRRIDDDTGFEPPAIDLALVAHVQDLAAEAEPTIGYRRHPMTCRDLPGGWAITIPGQMTRDFEDDGGTWIAFDDSRTVRFSSLTITAAPGTPPPTLDDLSDGDIATLTPSQNASEPITWSSRSTQGRVTVSAEIDPDGNRAHVANATIVVGWNLGMCTVTFDSIEDRDWAIEVCRSCVLLGGSGEEQ